MQGRTTLVIAHRLSTVTQRRPHRRGRGRRIVEEGTHDQLLRQGRGLPAAVRPAVPGLTGVGGRGQGRARRRRPLDAADRLGGRLADPRDAAGPCACAIATTRRYAWEREERRFLIAFWHRHLIFMRYAYRGSRMTVLVSRVATARCSRGSSATWARHQPGIELRGGAAGLRDLLRQARDGSDIAAQARTARAGPLRKVQPGRSWRRPRSACRSCRLAIAAEPREAAPELGRMRRRFPAAGSRWSTASRFTCRATARSRNGALRLEGVLNESEGAAERWARGEEVCDVRSMTGHGVGNGGSSSARRRIEVVAQSWNHRNLDLAGPARRELALPRARRARARARSSRAGDARGRDPDREPGGRPSPCASTPRPVRALAGGGRGARGPGLAEARVTLGVLLRTFRSSSPSSPPREWTAEDAQLLDGARGRGPLRPRRARASEERNLARAALGGGAGSGGIATRSKPGAQRSRCSPRRSSAARLQSLLPGGADARPPERLGAGNRSCW